MRMHLMSERLVEFVAHPGAEPPGPNGYRIERISTDSDLCVLRDVWTGLIDEAPAATIFETWEWVSTWWRHYRENNDLWVLAAWDATNRLSGVVPWMIAKDGWGPLRLYRLTFIGRNVAGPVHLDLIARRDERADVAAAFLAYLDAHRPSWDLLDLGDMAANSSFNGCLGSFRGRCRQLAGAPAQIGRLPETCTGNERANLNGAWERLEQDHRGDVRLYQITELAEVRRAVDAMAQLSQTGRRRTDEGGPYDDDKFLAFYRDISAIAFVNGWLRLYVLTVAGEMIGALCGFLYHGTFYCYRVVFSRNWSRYDPGTLLLGYAAERALRDGATEFDMMRGEEEHCLPWPSTERPDRHLVFSSTWAGRLWPWGGKARDAARALARRWPPKDWRRHLSRSSEPKELR